MDKYDQLEKLYPRSRGQIEVWRKQEKRAIIMLDIKDHPAIKALEDELVKSVGLINSKLLADEQCSEVERERLLVDRKRCEWFLVKFPNAEKSIKRINKQIQKKL